VVAADDVEDVEDVDVPAGLVEFPPVNFTTAKTSNVRTIAVSTPRPTSTAGLRDQGVGGSGGGCWPA